MRLTTHTYVEKENRVGRMLQRAAFFILHSSFFILLMAACSSDDPSATGDNGQVVPPSETNGKLTLRIATHNDVTRAAWQDNNATDDEMMNLWVVVLTDNSGNVQKSWACRPTAGSDDQEIDEIGQIAKGTYTAYSFANISVANVCTLLGLPAGAVPTIGATPTELAISGTITRDDAAAKTATINGNGFDPTALDNGYGEKGIPMSNVQTIAATDTEKDLIVIRMLAKVELQLFNETGADVTIQSATLSDITTNATNNLKLLPRLTSGQDRMDAVHKDLQPNLNTTATTADYTYTPATALTVPANYDYDTNKTAPAHKLTFYVNESAKPVSADKLFYLTLKLSTGEYRYALISNQSDEWNYIARNDYRVLPVVLDDYQFEIIPYDFPPIGVYPCSVKELDATENLYEMTFHDYGHFHLVPQVTKRIDGSTVPYGSTGGTSTYWTLDTDWPTTFKTAATKGGAWLTAEQVNANGFYVSGSTATTDADDNGGVPVFDATTVWNGFTPFIFGKIAEPDAAWWANPTDKQIYHEMRVKLYVNGTYRRDMIYRFYMTLSADQLLSAPQLRFAPRRSHRP